MGRSVGSNPRERFGKAWLNSFLLFLCLHRLVLQGSHQAPRCSSSNSGFASGEPPRV